MPYKPQIEYKDIEVPAALVRTANALAKICLDKNEMQLTFLNFNELANLAKHYFDDKVDFVYNRSGLVAMELAGFTFYKDGDVSFDLKTLIGKSYIHLFNADFYGPVEMEQLYQFIEYLNKNLKDLWDIYDWKKYKIRMKKK